MRMFKFDLKLFFNKTILVLFNSVLLDLQFDLSFDLKQTSLDVL